MDSHSKVAALPSVSILMLTYNRERYIREAVTSVLQQTYTTWELIIIDDGSTDQTETYVESLNDPRIHYVRHAQNEGLFKSRAESLTYVHGTYIAVLDSDDMWSDPEKLERQVHFLEQHPEHVLVGTYAELIDADGQLLGKKTYETDDAAIRNHILIQNQFIHSSVLMRTSAVEKTHGYQPTLAEDLELFLQLGVQGKFANLPDFSMRYRIHTQSENDRGLAMAHAVHTIVQTHKHQYPSYLSALLMSLLRITKAGIKSCLPL